MNKLSEEEDKIEKQSSNEKEKENSKNEIKSDPPNNSNGYEYIFFFNQHNFIVFNSNETIIKKLRSQNLSLRTNLKELNERLNVILSKQERTNKITKNENGGDKENGGLFNILIFF